MERTLGNELSGHSARRSGAMMYVNAIAPPGSGVSGKMEIICKSNMVLTYAEEALEEVLANQRVAGQSLEGGSGTITPSGWLCNKMPATPVPETPRLESGAWSPSRRSMPRVGKRWWCGDRNPLQSFGCTPLGQREEEASAMVEKASWSLDGSSFLEEEVQKIPGEPYKTQRCP